MIQFNLLPDVKLDYVHAKRVKRRVMVIAFIVSSASLAVLVFSFLIVNVFQKNHIKNLTKNISELQSSLENKQDIPKIVTIQSQLASLTCQTDEDFKSKPCLHEKKPDTTRLFKYLTKIVPEKVSISQLSVDFDQKTMQFQGTAGSLNIINKFVDTLKFTNFKDKNGSDLSAFSGVVLSSFDKSDSGFSYTIDLSFNAQIFDSQVRESLNVPKNTITTRSVLENPTKDLFKEQPKSENNQTQSP